jgi:hypothetical protein
MAIPARGSRQEILATRALRDIKGRALVGGGGINRVVFLPI